jgi:hypothetical protein
VPLLLADIGPNLIDLDAATGQLAHLFVHQLRTTLADLDQQAADRIAMRPGHALRRTDRIAFDQAVDDRTRRASGTRFIGLPFRRLYAV